MIKVGDIVVRMVAESTPLMKIKVTSIDNHFIHCGPWKFDKHTGAEVDEELGWGATYTGSYICKKDEEAN